MMRHAVLAQILSWPLKKAKAAAPSNWYSPAHQIPDDLVQKPPADFFDDKYYAEEESKAFHVGHELVDRTSKGTFCNMCDEVLPPMVSLKKYVRGRRNERNRDYEGSLWVSNYADNSAMEPLFLVSAATSREWKGGGTWRSISTQPGALLVTAPH